MTNCKNCGKSLGNPKATHCVNCAVKEYRNSMEKTFPRFKDMEFNIDEL